MRPEYELSEVGRQLAPSSGRGATFFVDVPLNHQPEESQPLMA